MGLLAGFVSSFFFMLSEHSLEISSSKMECLGCEESSVYVVRLETLVLDVNMPEKLCACL